MKGKNLEELLDKKIKLETFSGNEYEGIVIGYVPAQDNEPEVEEISIRNEKDNKTYSIFENEVKNIKILENIEK
ncbi:MAG: hypothetical protein SPF22_08955 [Candidatus Onthovivens sp.]|nr:hypothetical protein [Candidatus Onthovivens sp.]DAK92978.1 MAG TPA: Gemin6 6 [Caudoviricetes sp.]